MTRLASESRSEERFTRFLRNQGASLERAIAPPTSLRNWDERLAKVRAGLEKSFGRIPTTPCPLDPEILGTIQRNGYVIERLTFQSRPGVRVTANLYRPDPVVGQRPALLSVHGHWAWARMDPHVQPRCIALAKMGYVVLCVDAFGAGERAISPGPGTYHGALTGASLWPVGTPLIGLQVYDNRRAVDYLISRSEVDPAKLAITGASGGGNQSLYAGATDDRLAAVVPVCGIGTYDAYLTTACCVCEVNVGGLTYATTGDLLAMVAPRALLVISATRDAFQFSVGEARKSIDYARSRFRLLGQEQKLHQAAVDSGHDYNREMREALYGWLDQWLMGRGDGRPVPEPEIKLEDPVTLRCYPDAASRPRTIVTIPQFAKAEGEALLARLPPVPDHRERWNADVARMTTALRETILGRFSQANRESGTSRPGARVRMSIQKVSDGDTAVIRPETGLELSGLIVSPGTAGTALYLDTGDSEPTAETTKKSFRTHFSRANVGWMEVGLRGLGKDKATTAPIVGVPDHTEAEWALWLGRPLLGQWVSDTIDWLTALDEWRVSGEPLPSGGGAPARPYFLCATGPLSLVALVAAAIDPRVAGVFVSGCAVSFVAESDRPWAKVPMGVIVPDLLKIADVAQIVGQIAPRQVVVSNGMTVEGDVASRDRLRSAFAWPRRAYRLLAADARFSVGADLANLPEVLFP